MKIKNKKLPYLPLWVAEYVEGTAEMTCQELGAYQRLLNHSWTHGGIKKDDWQICLILREKPEVWDKIKGVVLDKFYEENGLLFNEKLEAVRIKSQELSKRQSDRAKKRWSKDKKDATGYATADATGYAGIDAGIDAGKHTNLNPIPYTLKHKTKNTHTHTKNSESACADNSFDDSKYSMLGEKSRDLIKMFHGALDPDTVLELSNIYKEPFSDDLFLKKLALKIDEADKPKSYVIACCDKYGTWNPTEKKKKQEDSWAGLTLDDLA